MLLCVINVIYYFCFLNQKCITSFICVHDCTHILTQVSSRGHISARHICCITSTQHTPNRRISGPRCSFDNVTGPFHPSRNHQIVHTWLPLEHDVHASRENGCHGEPKPHPQGNNGCSTIRGWNVKMCNMGKEKCGRGWVYLLYLPVPRPMPQQWMDYITIMWKLCNPSGAMAWVWVPSKDLPAGFQIRNLALAFSKLY